MNNQAQAQKKSLKTDCYDTIMLLLAQNHLELDLLMLELLWHKQVVCAY